MINFFPNDPAAAELPLREVAALPDRPAGRAGFTVAGSDAEHAYPPGTSGFLRWQSRQAAILAVQAWEGALGRPLTAWAAAVEGPLQVRPDAGEDLNAFYDRTGLSFFHQQTGDHVTYSGASTDVVAHETGHAILDALKPGWLLASNPPQTGGLHESFGDLTAIFLALNQLDQCEALIAQTKADLHAKNFLSDLAEQFGLALGRPNGLRNADNNLRLSEVGTEVHAISQVFTGGMFDVLADLFALERHPDTKDDAAVLHDVAGYLASVLIRGLRAAPNTGATYAHVVSKMLGIVVADGKPPAYRQALLNAFSAREVIAPTALSMNGDEGVEVEPGFAEDPNAPQDRSTCCGTMQLPEFTGTEDELAAELDTLAKGPFA